MPWDDDVDLAMEVKDAPKVRKWIKKFGKYETFVNRKSVLKIWHQEKSNISAGFEWKWPFVDIFLYKIKVLTCVFMKKWFQNHNIKVN